MCSLPHPLQYWWEAKEVCHLQNTAYCIQDNELDLKRDPGSTESIIERYQLSDARLYGYIWRVYLEGMRRYAEFFP